eukprot:TRINITY_DN6517_c0_g1_i1.p1 TRINITY_DN6517_c0_g1~~TRINITY_DN6517_c0_g1_i1.p1  ORF type:complete len:758 (+),score=170.68 TRINITY_DN6517_c0_g1_i1:168-2441(+)
MEEKPSPELIRHKIFDAAFILDLEHTDGKNQVLISHSVLSSPEVINSLHLPSIYNFCFPDLEEIKPTLDWESETFSFVLTESDGSKRYGFTARFLPAGMFGYPRCICIITTLRDYNLFSQILSVSEKLYSIGLSFLEELLNGLLNHPIPNAGETLVINLPSKHSYSFVLPVDRDNIADLVNFEQIMKVLSPENILQIFAGILMERRYVFISKRVATLSNFIQVFMSLLYPFSWQFVFIPVLPPSLLTFCCAPMPFVAGVLQSCLPAVQKMMDLMSEVYVFDFDSNQYIVLPPEIEQDTLPQPHFSHLLHKLEKLSRETNKKHRDPEKKKTFNKRVREAFLVFWVDVIGTYRRFLPTDDSRFNSQLFIISQSPETNQFLENLTKVQMFEVFIRERERLKEAMFFQGPFEERVSMIERFEDALSRVSGKEAKSLHDALSNLKGGSKKQLKAEIKGMKAKTKANRPEIHHAEEELEEPKMQVSFRAQESPKILHQSSEIIVGSHRLDHKSKTKVVEPYKSVRTGDLSSHQDIDGSFSCPDNIFQTEPELLERWIHASVPVESKRLVPNRFSSVSVNDFNQVQSRKQRKPERLSLSLLHHNLIRKKTPALHLNEELGRPPIRDSSLYPSLISPRENPSEVRESKRSNSVGSLADVTEWFAELSRDPPTTEIKTQPRSRSPTKLHRSTTGDLSIQKLKHFPKSDSEDNSNYSPTPPVSTPVKLTRGLSSPIQSDISKNPNTACLFSAKSPQKPIFETRRPRV